MNQKLVKQSCFDFLVHIESYTNIGPVLDYPKTVDYILERNLMKFQHIEMAIFTFYCQNWSPYAMVLI